MSYEEKTETYKGLEISYAIYGENREYSAKGSVRLPDSNPLVGLTLKFEGLTPPSQTLEDAEFRILSEIKKYIDHLEKWS